MLYAPFESMMSWMGPMGQEWAIALVAGFALATGALVLVTHSRRSMDAPRRPGRAG
jgi:hypothetical protein